MFVVPDKNNDIIRDAYKQLYNLYNKQQCCLKKYASHVDNPLQIINGFEVSENKKITISTIGHIYASESCHLTDKEKSSISHREQLPDT